MIRGAEIGSDHHLVLMKVNLLSRSKTKRKEVRWQLRSERLKTKEHKRRFQARLGHQIHKARHLSGVDIKRAWREFKGCIMETAEAVLYVKKKMSDWCKENYVVE